MNFRLVRTLVLLRILVTMVAVPSTLEAAPINGRTVLAPNPATDWLIGRVRDSMLKRLELSGDQLRSIHEVMDAHRVALWNEVIAAKEARLSLIEQMRATDLRAEAIERTYSEVAETELQLLIHTAAMLQEIRQLLTPEQLAEVDLLIDEFRQGAELRFEDLEEVFANGELLGRKWRRKAFKDSVH